MVCGLPLALSVIDTLAARLPLALGVKVALIVQLAPTATVFGLSGQVLVWAKSPALVPPTATLLIVRAAVPLLVTVTVCAPLVVLTAWLPKGTLVRLRLTAGADGATPLPKLSRTLAVVRWIPAFT